jgi:UDP:flavonoid glycosyltransferase YjiC (YdhE family)
MTRFLFATPPITGHVAPALNIARELTARGHELRWYVGGKFRSRVEETGAVFRATGRRMTSMTAMSTQRFRDGPR